MPWPDQIVFTVGPVCNLQDVLKKDPDALKLARADRFDVWLVLHGVCRRARAGVDGEDTVINEALQLNSEVGMTIQKDEFIRRIMERYLKQPHAPVSVGGGKRGKAHAPPIG